MKIWIQEEIYFSYNFPNIENAYQTGNILLILKTEYMLIKSKANEKRAGENYEK